MAWINGFERKRFDEEQKRLAEEYRIAGMTNEQIEQMYQFDLETFNSIPLPTAEIFLRSGLGAGSSFHRKNSWTGWKSRLRKVLSLRTSYFAVFVIFV